MKLLTIDGRLGRNAELKTTSGGTKYVKFVIANNEFEHGETTTNWYDVISYSDFTIEKQINLLTSGTYVLITGTPKEEVNVKDGRVFLNRSVNAFKIDIPSFKKKDDDEQEVSTYTASTKTEKVTEKKPSPAPVQKEEKKVTTQIITDENEDDDDLPF